VNVVTPARLRAVESHSRPGTGDGQIAAARPSSRPGRSKSLLGHA
jgi:hypothetical protein